MPQVSKRFLDKNTYKRIFEILLESFVKTKTLDDVSLFINDLLTPTEKIMLAKRLTIALLLKKGYSYGEIMGILKVSQGTVARVKETVRYGGKGYHQVLDKILKEEAVMNFLEKVDNLFLGMIPTYGKGSGMWRELKRQRRKEKFERASF